MCGLSSFSWSSYETPNSFTLFMSTGYNLTRNSIQSDSRYHARTASQGHGRATECRVACVARIPTRSFIRIRTTRKLTCDQACLNIREGGYDRRLHASRTASSIFVPLVPICAWLECSINLVRKSLARRLRAMGKGCMSQKRHG